MNFGEKPRKRIAINITSLVDILIVLLLFFMLTSQFIKMEVLHLNLSGNEKSGEAAVNKNATITITLLGEGRFELNGNKFNLLQLKEKIKPLLKDAAGSPVLLLSKSRASVQDIVSAMDYIKSVGGNNISVEEDASDAGK